MNMRLSDFIQKQGWSMYGVSSIEEVKMALNRHKPVFDEWVKNGYEADMDYLERMEEDRFHPENKIPNVKSVITLGAIYSSGESGDMVAKYAGGRDYHNVLKKKLVELSDFLKERNPGISTYVSVDSGPTVDRVLAEVAGIGFFGKNCNIVNPKMGSYFFIANLITDLSLDSYSPFERMPSCGDCKKCLNTCPTGSLISPGVIDARKCISYLTIENKGGIPIELREKIGEHLFGCDECQGCCPFNERGQEVLIEDFIKKGEVDIKEIFSIKTDEDFLSKFAGTAIMRAKRIGLLRNTCIVAGNSGDVCYIPYLEEIIKREKDEMIKECAEWGIMQIKK